MLNKNTCKYCGSPIVLVSTDPNHTTPCNPAPIVYRANNNGSTVVINIAGYAERAEDIKPYELTKADPNLIGRAMGYTLHKNTCPNYKNKGGRRCGKP